MSYTSLHEKIASLSSVLNNALMTDAPITSTSTISQLFSLCWSSYDFESRPTVPQRPHDPCRRYTITVDVILTHVTAVCVGGHLHTLRSHSSARCHADLLYTLLSLFLLLRLTGCHSCETVSKAINPSSSQLRKYFHI